MAVTMPVRVTVYGAIDDGEKIEFGYVDIDDPVQIEMALPSLFRALADELEAGK